MMDEFKYLGSLLHHSGTSNYDITECIARAFWAYGMLNKAVFKNQSLSLKMKRNVYKAAILATGLDVAAFSLPWSWLY